MPHRPYIREVKDAPVAVLMVHGILGSPRHFDMLLPHIPDTWAVYNIVLDGHGATARDFARTSRKKWEAQVLGEVTRVCQSHERVVIVAHSMGCMLTMNAAVQSGLSHKIAAMFFLGAALKPMCTPTIARTAFHMLFCQPNPNDPCEMAARTCCGTAIHKRIWEYLAWIPRFVELFMMASYTARRVPAYDLPMTVLQSYRDEVVGRGSIKPFLKNPHAKAEFLMQSSHFYYEPTDLQRICDVFCDVVQNVNKNSQKVAVCD